MSKIKTIGIGEVLWDVFPDRKCLGGAPLNFACHCLNLGGESKMISAIGDDDLGREILAELETAGMDTGSIEIDPEHETGTVQVTLDAAGSPSYEIKKPVAWDNIVWNPGLAKFAEDCDAVCFGSLAQRSPVSRDTIIRFLHHTGKDCLKIFDINLRQHYFSQEIIHESLQLSNMLKLNDEELPVLSEFFGLAGSETEKLKTLMQQYSLEFIAFTRGAKGSLLMSRETVSEHAGIATQVIDPVGAGDSFTAAVCMGILQGKGLDEINHSANKIASYVCSQPGATPKLHDGIIY